MSLPSKISIGFTFFSRNSTHNSFIPFYNFSFWICRSSFTLKLVIDLRSAS